MKKKHSTPTLEETLVAKRTELDGVANLIALYARPLNLDERVEVNTLEERMEYRLSQLVLRSKIEEADIKIEIMKKVLDITKRKPAIVTPQ